MNFFWPCAITTEHGKSCYLSTPLACTSFDEAASTIEQWLKTFDVACSWLEDRGEGNNEVRGIYCMEVYVDMCGDAIKTCKNQDVEALYSRARKQAERCVELEERATPKKILYAETVDGMYGYICPKCHEIPDSDGNMSRFCTNCGQALDWSEPHDVADGYYIPRFLH